MLEGRRAGSAAEVVLGRGPAALRLWSRERDRGVVCGVEQIEVGKALGQAHDGPAGGAHDPSWDAEEKSPQRLGVTAQGRVLSGRLPGGARGGADVAHPGGDVQRQQRAGEPQAVGRELAGGKVAQRLAEL